MKEHRKHQSTEIPTWPRKLAHLALGGLAYYVVDRLVRRHTRRHIHEHVLDALENPPPDPAPTSPPVRTASSECTLEGNKDQEPPAHERNLRTT
jgi:hypothetical protein